MKETVQGQFKGTDKGKVMKGLNAFAFATSPPVIL